MKDCTSFTEDLDDQGIVGTHAVLPCHEAGGGGGVGEIDMLLDRDGKAVEWTDDFAGGLEVSVEFLGAFEGAVEEEVGDAICL